jgi:hypothetical protein
LFLSRCSGQTTPIAGTHRAHSGHLGEYVVWPFAGLAALTVLLRLQLG